MVANKNYYDMDECRNRIIQLRQDYGLSQSELAERMNVDRTTIGKFESGDRGASVDLFIKLSTEFDVSLDYLILGKRPVNNTQKLKQLIHKIVELLTKLEKEL